MYTGNNCYKLVILYKILYTILYILNKIPSVWKVKHHSPWTPRYKVLRYVLIRTQRALLWRKFTAKICRNPNPNPNSSD